MVTSISPYTTRLHAGNAYWMARLSKAVYTCTSEDNQQPDEGVILSELKRDDNGFLDVFGASKNSAQGALIEHKDYLCLAFRGTNEALDWLDNLNAFSVKKLFGSFHRGFYQSVEDIWTPLYTKLCELQKQNRRPVFITGHSLGGAMATIAGARFIQEDKPFTAIYTFGQPRALTRETAQIFNMECKDRYYRFHNNNDIVTRVPARIMGYSHVGSYLYISQEKQISREAGFWFRFLDYIDGALDAFMEKGFDGIEDHDIKDYLAAISAWDLREEGV
jgi:hypothetical protein